MVGVLASCDRGVEACPFSPGSEPPRKLPMARAIISPVLKIRRSLPRKRYLLLALLLVTYFSYITYLITGAQTPQPLSNDKFVYVDDVSLTVDGALVYSTSFPLGGSTDFPHNGMDEFTLANPESVDLSFEDRHSSPCSIRFDSSPDARNGYRVASLSLTRRVADWNRLNVTWYEKGDAPGAPFSGVSYYGSVNHVLSARFESTDAEGGGSGSYLETVVQAEGQQALFTIHSGEASPGVASYWLSNYGLSGHRSESTISEWDSQHWYRFSLIVNRAGNTAGLYVDGGLVSSMFLPSEYGALEELSWLGFRP